MILKKNILKHLLILVNVHFLNVSFNYLFYISEQTCIFLLTNVRFIVHVS